MENSKLKKFIKFNESLKGMELTEDEKSWVKSWLIASNNQWGFDSKDMAMLDTILTKLNIS
jgi:hypothetical protein